MKVHTSQEKQQTLGTCVYTCSKQRQVTINAFIKQGSGLSGCPMRRRGEGDRAVEVGDHEIKMLEDL